VNLQHPIEGRGRSKIIHSILSTEQFTKINAERYHQQHPKVTQRTQNITREQTKVGRKQKNRHRRRRRRRRRVHNNQ
ncbi:MAG: hypothetical protein ACI8RD_000221, partial [Bacillariaceae sp.]|jgi:hypothetical protein